MLHAVGPSDSKGIRFSLAGKHRRQKQAHMLQEVQTDLQNCAQAQIDLLYILHILYMIALRSGICLFETATVKTRPTITAKAQQQLFTVGAMECPSVSSPHRAHWTNSTTLPEKKIAAGILHRQGVLQQGTHWSPP